MGSMRACGARRTRSGRTRASRRAGSVARQTWSSATSSRGARSGRIPCGSRSLPPRPARARARCSRHGWMLQRRSARRSTRSNPSVARWSSPSSRSGAARRSAGMPIRPALPRPSSSGGWRPATSCADWPSSPPMMRSERHWKDWPLRARLGRRIGTGPRSKVPRAMRCARGSSPWPDGPRTCSIAFAGWSARRWRIARS